MRFLVTSLAFSILLMLSNCGGVQPEDQQEESSNKVENDQEEYKLVVEQSIVWHFEDEFDKKEKEFLINWIQEVFNATETVLGDYPFPMHVFFYDAGASSEPVPWAHTRRAPTQQVHFHVDLNYTAEEFISDWTAPHEISHLSIPFLGKANSWFAEGYASFMQYQIMEELGIYNAEEVEHQYIKKFKRYLSYVDDSEGSFDELLMLQRQQHNYPAMYWGGAFFFYVLHQELKKEELTLATMIEKYLACCRNDDRNVKDLIDSWTDISGHHTRELYENFTNLSGLRVLEKYRSF